MKRILILLLTTFTLSSEAQVFNNEWIDYNKTYYKFKVGATGLYRIRQSTLVSIGLSTTNADYFQLWRNGKEVPIYTSVQNMPLGAADYLEFWGEMNDGKPDFDMYREVDYQLSDKWSLQTDTAAFFLTVNPAGGNLRLQPTLNDIAGNTLSPEPFFLHTEGKYFRDKIHPGRAEQVGSSYTYSSSYDAGEGWTSPDLANSATRTTTFTNLQVYSGAGAPEPVIKINAVGNAVNARSFRVRLNADSVAGQLLDYYDIVRFIKPVTVSQISSGTATIDITNLCTTPNDRMTIAQVELNYARQFNFGGTSNFYFELPANAAGNYLEISGFTSGGTPPVLYDLSNGKRYVGDISNPSLVKVALQPSAIDRKLLLVSQVPGNIFDAASFEQRNFINYALAANQGDFLIITSAFLAGPSGGIDPIEDYRMYRSSSQGGSYNAKVYLIDQLIDQFALGIKMHPLSIRNFLRWSRVNFSVPLKNVLLVGKGVVYSSYRGGENNPDMTKLCLVPTFGFPASDILLSAVGNSSIPLTPIGRLSVINKAEIQIYLNKVKEYEVMEQSAPSPLIADMAWKKNVIHVTGASDEGTTNILQAANDGFKAIIEDTSYGGKVYSFTKSTSASVQQLKSSELSALFAQGLGLITYFGHSSATTLEFNLDNPQNYNNPGKYPVMIVMGCNAGDLYKFNLARLFTNETISEKYILTKDRGAIAFLASSHLGIVHYLDMYNTRAYQALTSRLYGASVGEIMDDAIRRMFLTTTEDDFYSRFQCEEFALHGDPAIRPYHFLKPDYAIEEQLVKASPSFISIAETSFKVKANFMNIGKAVNRDIVVELKRVFPDLSVEIRRDTIPGVRYLDSIIYDLQIVGSRDKGLNKITITIDVDNVVDELYETNNSITKDVYIFEDELRPVYPYNLSIVTQQNTKLMASTANAFAVSMNYLMEIDTTELFNSPLKVARSTSSTGGVVEFSPGITFTDSTVYYWRVAPFAPTGDTKWNIASFIYISGSEAGFNQSHLYQHFKSEHDRLIVDSASGKLSYGNSTHNMFIRSAVFGTGFTQADGFAVYLDDKPGIASVCGVSNIVFNVIDPITFQPWLNGPVGPGQYGSDPICGFNRAWNFQYNILDTNKRRKIAEFMDLIPDGYYVIARNCSDANPASNTYAADWKNDVSFMGAGNTIYDRFVAQGFTNVDSFYRPRAFVFVYRKNSAATFTPRMTFSDGLYDAITMSVNVQTPDTVGVISSPVFGPARGWKQLHWRGESADLTPGDDVKIDVYGVDYNGVETPLIVDLTTANQDYDISSIDAVQYPNVRLKMRNKDVVFRTPYQLHDWMITYNPAPEGAIAPNLYFITKDTVEAGEPLNFGIAFKNISNVSFDSLAVKLAVTDKNNIESIIPVPLQKNLAPADTIKLTVPIDTRSLSGNCTVFINFNPDRVQTEQHLFNNYAFHSLFVKTDSLNPIMDVTFDGMHILNKDIVSAKPAIVVSMKDEARWMILDDTSLLTVQVRYPNGTLRRFNFNNNNDTLQFIPAGQAPSVNNTASINFNPYFMQDGEYELIVTGKDRNGNQAGGVDYRVSFRVINKPMISNMLNYPNPFTTSTAFVFTLTGSNVPQNIRIQILTITGKVVREITKDELGPLRIGRNITEFKWDGTDQYGQKLANGIYLYRVITNLNGKSLDKYNDKAEKNSDNTDKYFNKGYGKMYLMR